MFIRNLRYASIKIKCFNFWCYSFSKIFSMHKKEKRFQAFFKSISSQRIESKSFKARIWITKWAIFNSWLWSKCFFWINTLVVVHVHHNQHIQHSNILLLLKQFIESILISEQLHNQSVFFGQHRRIISHLLD